MPRTGQSAIPRRRERQADTLLYVPPEISQPAGSRPRRAAGAPPRGFASLANEATAYRADSRKVVNRLWTKRHRLWMMALVGPAYAYELRRGEEILSTGRLTSEEELAPGDEVTIAGILAQVEELSWVNGEVRLLLQPVLGLTAA
jgi:hypothetical protein